MRRPTGKTIPTFVWLLFVLLLLASAVGLFTLFHEGCMHIPSHQQKIK